MKKFYFLLSTFYFLPALVFAQIDSPGDFVNKFYNWALALSGVLAFGAIVWGGVVYTFARGNPAGQSEGKKWISGALLGLALLGGAYLLLYTINPEIVSLRVAGLQGLPAGTTSGGVTPITSSLNCSPTTVGMGTCKNCANSPAVNTVLFGGCLDARIRNSVTYTFNGQHTCRVSDGATSCHFGGRTCSDGAHAIDFGRNALASNGLTVPQAEGMLKLASCPGITTIRCELGAQTVPCNIADHIHVNVANSSCGCN